MTEFQSFSAYIKPKQAVVRVPVTLYNTGAKPLVFVDLRINLSSEGHTCVAASRSYRKSVEPIEDDVLDFPHPYVVDGRSVVTKFVEFVPKPRVMATGKPAQMTFEVFVSARGWRKAGSYELRTDIIGDPAIYITYSNNPAHWPEGQLEKAQTALEAVRSAVPPSK